MVKQAAQNQHYVPKFILRNFLIDDRREQVAAFSKRTGKVFTPSIKGIMAERRFHEFTIDEKFRASFEEAIGQLEELVLPVYRRVVEKERLSGDPDERALLAFLIAFQLVRTRSQRDQFLRMEELLSAKLEGMGANLSDVEGWERFDDDNLTRQHIHSVRESLPQFSEIIAAKNMMLMKAPEGTSFYLSDNPVAMHNEEPAHPFWGNIGLSVRGIQIYLPLSPSLTLAAWCPSLLAKMKGQVDETRRNAAIPLLAELKASRISADQMRDMMNMTEEALAPATAILAAAGSGTPFTATAANVDYFNSLQVWSAREFILSKDQDFSLARSLVRENPDIGEPRWRDAAAAHPLAQVRAKPAAK